MALIGKTKTLADLAAKFRFRTLLQGDAFSGKTSIALQFPKPMVYIDTEHGVDKYQNIEGTDGVYIFHPTTVQNPKYDSNTYDPNAADAEHPGVVDIVTDLVADPQGIKTIVIDSISDVHTMLNSLIIAFNRNKLIDQKKYDEAQMATVDLNQFNLIKNNFKDFMNFLKKLDMNIVCTTREKAAFSLDKNADGPQVVADTDKSIEYYFDEFVRCVKDKIVGQDAYRRSFHIMKCRGDFPDNVFPKIIRRDSAAHTYKEYADFVDPNRGSEATPDTVQHDSSVSDYNKSLAKARNKTTNFRSGTETVSTAGLTQEDYENIVKIAKKHPELAKGLNQKIQETYGVLTIFDLTADEGANFLARVEAAAAKL